MKNHDSGLCKLHDPYLYHSLSPSVCHSGVSIDAVLCLDLIFLQHVTSHRPGQDHCLAAQVFNSVGQTCDELTQILTRYALHWKPNPRPGMTSSKPGCAD